MAYRNNRSSDHRDWTNAKLMEELRRTANLETFSGSCGFNESMKLRQFPADNGPVLREHTRIYRDSWMNPLLDEIARRFVKTKP